MRGRDRTRRTLEEHGAVLPWGRAGNRAATRCTIGGTAARMDFTLYGERCHAVVTPHPEPSQRAHVASVVYSTAHGTTLARVIAIGTAQHFGGRRWYLLCPGCDTRRAFLTLRRYRLAAGPACRACHRLHYVSQRLDTVERLRYRTRKLYARAEAQHWATAPNPHDGCDAPTIPRYRKWTRAQREWEAWRDACDRLDAAFYDDVGRSLEWIRERLLA